MTTAIETTAVPADAELWARLQAMALDDPEAGIALTHRLTTNRRWTAGYTERALAEYKRFLYLAVHAGHPVTPSRIVDAVWHEHIVHTRHYSKVMCDTVLGREFHHDPGMGMDSDDERYGAQYRRTLDSYRAAFGTEPPADIWPRPGLLRLGQRINVGLTVLFVLGAMSSAPVVCFAAVIAMGGVAVLTGAGGSGTDSAGDGSDSSCGGGCGGD